MRWMLVLVTITCLGGAASVARAAELPPELLAACRDELPGGWADAAEAGAVRGAGPDGEWWIESADVDGAGPAEALLVVLPANRRGAVQFFALRDGKVKKKKVKLGGDALTSVSVRFEPFAENRALVHVDGGESGQALLHWNGKKLDTVWKVGTTATADRHWFVLEDLDGDAVAEVVTYSQRELDVFTDEDELDDSAAGSADVAPVDVGAVYRWHDGRWTKDGELLEGLR